MPSPFNMQTFHSVNVIGESYTGDFLKDSCEGIGHGGSMFTNNEPTGKLLALSVHEIKLKNQQNKETFMSPLLNIDLNKKITNEDYLKFMKKHNHNIKEEQKCQTKNKVRCYKLNSSEHDNTCNEISIDKLNRHMHETQNNYSDVFDHNFESPMTFVQQGPHGLYR